MMLVLEIAGGIVLAIILLNWWQEILSIGAVAVAVILGLVVVVSVLGWLLGWLMPSALVMPWLVLLGLLAVAGCVIYASITGRWNISEAEAQEWAAKSTFDKWVHRIAMSSVGFIFGGGALAWALNAIGWLR